MPSLLWERGRDFFAEKWCFIVCGGLLILLAEEAAIQPSSNSFFQDYMLGFQFTFVNCQTMKVLRAWFSDKEKCAFPSGRKVRRNLQELKGGILVIELQIEGGCVVEIVVVKKWSNSRLVEQLRGYRVIRFRIICCLEGLQFQLLYCDLSGWGCPVSCW